MKNKLDLILCSFTLREWLWMSPNPEPRLSPTHRRGWQLTHSLHAGRTTSSLSFISVRLFIHFSVVVLQYHRAALGHKRVAIKHLEFSLGAANRIMSCRSTMTRWGSSWASGVLTHPERRGGMEWKWHWPSLKNGLLDGTWGWLPKPPKAQA